MPSLKEIKTRIASVNNTRKITSAMKMVASSKLHHAQTAIQNMLPYENMLEHILKSFLISVPEVQTIYNVERPVLRRVALVVFSSNSSLCGGFNSNVIKKMLQAIDEYHSQGVKDVVVYPVGRKVAEKVKKLGIPFEGPFLELADKPNAQGCTQIASGLMEKYAKGEIDRVELVFHHFKSAGSQILLRRTLLPIDINTELGALNDRDLSSNMVTAKAQEYLRKKGQDVSGREVQGRVINDDFIVEPDLTTVLSSLIPKLLHLMVYTALLDSNASEHAARMVAMQTATDNADEILRDLNLQYNKSRQQAITSELLDIVGGQAR
ncbi:MAG: F0F1 ATP synthase subunit gamma [Prevotella sp.]|nr:F0F1 ATP synthase subunit gamma [Bacteroidales bacterium]MDY4706705.1 F0F1 ATP synthase subunit gamma [Prevotella sp.]MCI6101631.1 F0F1 ATP synthase subunit gamma [Bacteroidales bacterium]MCI7653250.1 F0F1 ATP synthase subunit gamma [Bacteroidales bacterium]MDD7705319.1 F0F1 ATP synthase subunit gamma [Bacteroidales bacterium]